MGLLLFVLILTTALLVHELGHAVAMINNGVQIKSMGLGLPLGKPIFQSKWERFPGVNFEIHPLLLGAFVQPSKAGAAHMETLPYKAKADIYAAGAWANILFFMGISLFVNTPHAMITGAAIKSANLAIMILIFIALIVMRDFVRRYLLPIIGIAWFALVLHLIFQNPLNSVSGPIGIIGTAKKESVNIMATIYFGGYISLMLGLFNAIPIYPLDGGKIVELFFKNEKARQVFRSLGTVTFLIIILLAFTTDFVNLLR